MSSALSTLNSTTEVRPLRKAPKPQLLPGLCIGCLLLRVCVRSRCVWVCVCVCLCVCLFFRFSLLCVHLDWLNAEHKFQVWDNTSRPFLSFQSVVYSSLVLHSPTFTIIHTAAMYIPGTTCLHIPLAHPCLYYYLLSPQYTVLHILFYCTFLNLYLCIFSCVVLRLLHCPLSGPDLIYISLLIIFCIIEYVTNKKTLTLTCRHTKN